MSLAKLLRISRAALCADFQHYYRLRLTEILRGGVWSLREIGDLAVELPRGARIWVHMGGPAAITSETEMLYAIESVLNMQRWERGGGKGEQPKPREFPESAAAIDKKETLVTSRAERWKARHLPGKTE